MAGRAWYCSSVCSSVCLSGRLSVCLVVCLSVCSSVCLSACLLWCVGCTCSVCSVQRLCRHLTKLPGRPRTSGSKFLTLRTTSGEPHCRLWLCFSRHHAHSVEHPLNAPPPTPVCRSGVISHSGSTFVSTFQKQKADARKRRAFVTAHVKDVSPWVCGGGGGVWMGRLCGGSV